MKTLSKRTYLVSVGGGLLGLERVIGLLRRRRVNVEGFAVHPAERIERSRLMLTITSANHDQVRRQLARLIDVLSQTDIEEILHDEAA